MSFRATPTRDEPDDILGMNHHLIGEGEYTSYHIEVHNPEPNVKLNNLVTKLHDRIVPINLNTTTTPNLEQNETTKLLHQIIKSQNENSRRLDNIEKSSTRNSSESRHRSRSNISRARTPLGISTPPRNQSPRKSFRVPNSSTETLSSKENYRRSERSSSPLSRDAHKNRNSHSVSRSVSRSHSRVERVSVNTQSHHTYDLGNQGSESEEFPVSQTASRSHSRVERGSVNTLSLKDQDNQGSDSAGLTSFQNFFEKPKPIGPSLNPSLSKILNKVGQASNREEIKSLKEDYICPENVPNLKTPITNPEIWHLMHPRDQEKDKKIQYQSDLLIHTMRATSKALSNLQEMKTGTLKMNLNTIEVDLFNSIKFSSSLFNSMNYERKQMIRPVIPKPYNNICSKSSESEGNDFLFGSDLIENIKKTSDQTKLLAHLQKPKNPSGNRPSGQAVQGRRDHDYHYQNQKGRGGHQGGHQKGRGGFQKGPQSRQGKEPGVVPTQPWNNNGNIMKGTYHAKSHWNTKGRDPPQKRH